MDVREFSEISAKACHFGAILVPVADTDTDTEFEFSRGLPFRVILSHSPLLSSSRRVRSLLEAQAPEDG